MNHPEYNDWPDEIKTHYDKIRNKIKKHGHTIQGVVDGKDALERPFAYTIGASFITGAELLCFFPIKGKGLSIIGGIINRILDAVKEGGLTLNSQILNDFHIYHLPIAMLVLEEEIKQDIESIWPRQLERDGILAEFSTNDHKLVLLICTDKNGNFPWDEKCESYWPQLCPPPLAAMAQEQLTGNDSLLQKLEEGYGISTKTKIMELNEARKRFETIANKTGILSNPIIVEPNKKERDELWDITRSFLKRIYALDIQEGYSEEVYNEYNQLCHWAIVALHWNDLLLSDEGFSLDNGRFRRDTIALALCLYTRLSSRYKYFNKIKREFILPHAFGSILLWTLRSITDCNTDNLFKKFEPETTKEALKDYLILFNKYGFYCVKEDDYDNEDLRDIWIEIYYRFNSVRKPYQFALNYIWMGSALPGGMGLLSEDREMNKAQGSHAI